MQGDGPWRRSDIPLAELGLGLGGFDDGGDPMFALDDVVCDSDGNYGHHPALPTKRSLGL
jgi:hypothetical protein